MRTIYAIGDIHGMAGFHRLLLGKIVADAARKPGQKKLVYVGDYVDRGPDSRGVVSTVMAGPPEGIDEQICLMGNHEMMMIDHHSRVLPWLGWLTNGGMATIASYRGHGTELKEHLKWMEGLPLYHIDGRYLFVHAGIVPGIAIDKQRKRDMLWIRDRFLSSAADHGYTVVHGHTATDRLNHGNRIALDTSAWRTGVLTCAVLSEGMPMEVIDTSAEARQ